MRELTFPNGHGEVTSPQPWERQPTESTKAFQAFELYRSMGHERSLSKVGRELGKATQLLSRWSSRHEWQKRVAAWDAHQAQTINAEVLASTAEMRRRQVIQALELQSKAQKRLLKMSDAEIEGSQSLRALPANEDGSGDGEERARH